MDYEIMAKHILYELGINQRYIACDYIIYGIHLMRNDKSCVKHITKTLYVYIASKYDTTGMCVERVIRTTIETIWKNQPEHSELIQSIFGPEYLSHRPTNTVFFELLYDYIETLSIGPDRKCPFYGSEYCVVAKDA